MSNVAKKPVRVWNGNRSIRKGFSVSTLAELKTKGCLKLGFEEEEDKCKIVLESDGTEIHDEDYFQTLEAETIFIILYEWESWWPKDTPISRMMEAFPAEVLIEIHKSKLYGLIPTWKYKDDGDHFTAVIHWRKLMDESKHCCPNQVFGFDSPKRKWRSVQYKAPAYVVNLNENQNEPFQIPLNTVLQELNEKPEVLTSYFKACYMIGYNACKKHVENNIPTLNGKELLTQLVKNNKIVKKTIKGRRLWDANSPDSSSNSISESSKAQHFSLSVRQPICNSKRPRKDEMTFKHLQIKYIRVLDPHSELTNSEVYHLMNNWEAVVDHVYDSVPRFQRNGSCEWVVKAAVFNKVPKGWLKFSNSQLYYVSEHPEFAGLVLEIPKGSFKHINYFKKKR